MPPQSSCLMLFVGESETWGWAACQEGRARLWKGGNKAEPGGVVFWVPGMGHLIRGQVSKQHL